MNAADRPQLKYVRTDAGFATCPTLSGTAQPTQLATTVPFIPISAGFIDFDFDGLPFCHGRSETLNLNSMACDTAALRKEWGHRAGVVAPITLTPAMRADAEAIGACCDPMSLEVGDQA